MSRLRLLQKLQDDFNSNANINYILAEVFKIIEKFSKVRIIENSHFEDVFNDICLQIYKEETKSQVIELEELNELVINNVSEYIIDNINDFENTPIVTRNKFQRKPIKSNIEEIFEEDEPKKKPKKTSIKNDIKQIVVNQETMKVLTLDLNQVDTMFHLENVKSIKLKSVDIVNSDYMLNEKNNSFTFKIKIQTNPKILYSDEYKVVVPEGDYEENDLPFLLNTIINQMNQLSNKEIFSMSINPRSSILTLFTEEKEIDDKICPAEEFELLEGGLLDILGFKQSNVSANNISGVKPIFVSKQRVLPISISINNTEPIIYEKLYINKKRTLINDINSEYIYKTPIEIDNIFLDFDRYNFRGIPFYVKLEIKYI